MDHYVASRLVIEYGNAMSMVALDYNVPPGFVIE
jgi:hypothetical protein